MSMLAEKNEMECSKCSNYPLLDVKMKKETKCQLIMQRTDLVLVLCQPVSGTVGGPNRKAQILPIRDTRTTDLLGAKTNRRSRVF